MSEKGSGSASDQLREFHPVTDPLEAFNLLQEAVRSLASAMIWSKEQKHVLSSTLRRIDEQAKTMHAFIPTGSDPVAFLNGLEKLGSRDCFFSISLSRANIFFKAFCECQDPSGLRFRMPDKIYKVQRRKHARLLVPYTHVLRLTMPDPFLPGQKLSKKVFDISAGGLAVIISDQEASGFQPGQEIQRLSFSIRSRKITADAVVRHVRRQPPGSAHPGIKVGIEFTKIDRGDAEWIAAYIFEESRKSFMKGF